MKLTNNKWLGLAVVTTIFGSSTLFGQDTLNYTGMMETYTIPDGVSTIQIEVWGGEAEAETLDDFGGSIGGLGGYATGTLSVTSGDVLNVYVGGKGENGVGGWNGGGVGGAASAGAGGSAGFGGSGGGASDVRFGGTDLTDRIIVGGGGGGGGRNYVNGSCVPCGTGGNGGAGGGILGENGEDPEDEIYMIYYNVGAGATGGSDLVGGAAGAGTEGTAGMDGVLGDGGAGTAGEYGTAGGGGGGGYYGGGSGAAPGSGSGSAGGGGAGGSSYIGGVMDSLTTAGIRAGDGMVVITLICEAEIAMTPTVINEFAGADGEIDLDVTGGNGSYLYDWDIDGTGDFDDMEDLTGLVAGSYTVSISSGPACDTLTQTIVVTNHVGINEVETQAFEVVAFPNPTNGNTTIRVEGEFEYQILTVHGQVITNGVGLNTTEVDLSELENGVYFVTVNTSKQNKTIRLIKK